MEDILASIKRIIADDGNAALNATRGRKPVRAADASPVVAPGPTPIPRPTPSPEVLELTEAAPLPPAANPGDTAEPVTAKASPSPEAVAPNVPEPTATLVSSDAATASRQALAALSSVVVKPPIGAETTLDGLVREMLRPMLKEWLDQRLPELVEGLVAREIARITGDSL